MPRRRTTAAGLIVLILISAIGAGLPPAAALAAPAAVTFTVNNTFDVVADFSNDPGYTVCHTNPTNHICSLRAAIMNANRHAGGATIILPNGTYVLSLTPAGSDDDASGGLNISNTLSLVGGGAAGTIVDGAALDSIFYITTGTVVTLTGLTIRNGANGGNGSGGGIDNFGQLLLTNSIVIQNVAGLGGGIFNEQGATLLVRKTTIRDNLATLNSGGGIENVGTLTLENSTVSNNRALVGGGLSSRSPGQLTVVNSTISNNSATGTGGGVFAGSAAVFYHTTIAGNLADSANAAAGYGGGIYGAVVGQVHVWNSLFALNYQADMVSSCSGAGLTSDDYNYFQYIGACAIVGTTTHDVEGEPVNVGPLENNGGPTRTRVLWPGSLALDHIPPARCRDQFGAAPVPDQRGTTRPFNALCDMGAYEGFQARPIYGTNLILNGDAEGAAGSPAGAYVGTPYWTSGAGQFTAVPYNSAGGFPAVPTDMVPASHGYNFFAGGNSAFSSAIQNIDLKPASAAIDTGGLYFTLSADLGGYLTQSDSTTVEAIFYDDSFAAIGSPATIGPVTAGQRADLTSLRYVASTMPVPVGARSAQVTIRQTAGVGYNDGYADNVSFVLAPPNGLYLPVLVR